MPDSSNTTKPIDFAELKDFIDKVRIEVLSTDSSKLNDAQNAFLKDIPAELNEYLIDILPALEANLKESQIIIDALIQKKSKTEEEKTEVIVALERKKQTEEILKAVIQDIFVKACSAPKIEIEQLLEFQKKFSIDGKDFDYSKKSSNPFAASLACNRSVEDLQKLVNEGNCNPKFTDENGNNLAHYVAELQAGENAMKFAKDNGVDIGAKNKDGITALDIAKRNGDEKLAGFLENNTTRESFASRQRQAPRRQLKPMARTASTKTNTTQINTQDIYFEDENVSKKDGQNKENWLQFKTTDNDIDLDLEEPFDFDLFLENIQSAFQKIEDISSNSALNLDDLKDREKALSKAEEILGIEIDGKNINQILVLAILCNCSMLANLLVNHGADVNYQDNGKSIVEIAIERGASDSLVVKMIGLANEKTQQSALVQLKIAEQNRHINTTNIKEILAQAGLFSNSTLDPQEFTKSTPSPREVRYPFGTQTFPRELESILQTETAAVKTIR